MKTTTMTTTMMMYMCLCVCECASCQHLYLRCYVVSVLKIVDSLIKKIKFVNYCHVTGVTPTVGVK